MKRILMIAIVAACGGDGTGVDSGVDGNEITPDGGAVCGDGACGGDETPVTCPADCMEGGPVCGDGTCNGTESPANCAADCGAPACTAANDTCMDETICIAGACEPAFPRTYVITNVMVSLAATNQGGVPWDADATAPDLYVADITVPGSSTAISPVVANSLTATFTGPFEITLNASSKLQIDIWDDDSPPPVARQIAASCQVNPVSAYWFRPRTWGCTIGGSSITLTINPKAP